jgi:hypothetical protein
MGMVARNFVESYGSCTQAILFAFMDEFRIDEALVVRAAGAMHAGMLVSGTCGIFSAGMMILGLMIGRGQLKDGREGLVPIVFPAQALFCGLKSVLGSESCINLSGCDFRDPEAALGFSTSGANRKCHRLVQMGAEAIAHGLQEMVTTEEIHNP